MHWDGSPTGIDEWYNVPTPHLLCAVGQSFRGGRKRLTLEAHRPNEAFRVSSSSSDPLNHRSSEESGRDSTCTSKQTWVPELPAVQVEGHHLDVDLAHLRGPIVGAGALFYQRPGGRIISGIED